MILVSIIIPVAQINPYLLESVAHCRRQDYPAFEILVLPDEAPEGACLEGVRVIPTGPLNPGQKRNLALNQAGGEVLAFLDDDTFPAPGYLANGVRYFEDESIAAVGGPAVTPAEDDVWQQAGGFVYTSWLGGGNFRYRYMPRPGRDVDDYPSCNLLVRRRVFEQVGGFDNTFWPGEDTKLCLDVIGLGQRIRYAPDVLVYHHRRPLFRPHLSQVSRYAIHRGYFAKRYPQTSRRFTYFLPTLLLLVGMVALLTAIFWPALRLWVAGAALLYLLAVLLSAVQAAGWRLSPLVSLGIVATHLTYGLGFIWGLLVPRLKEEQQINL